MEPIKIAEDLSFLSIPKEFASKIIHSEDYIKNGTGENTNRKIFENVPYDEFEVNLIKQIRTKYEEKNNTTSIEFSDGFLLRFIHDSFFNINKALLNLENHVQWKKDFEINNLSEKAFNFIKNGMVYINGKDFQLRPLIFIDVTSLSKNDEENQAFLEAVSFMVWVAFKYMFYAGKIENFRIFIEVKDLSMKNCPIVILKKAIDIVRLNFPCSIEKIYILHPNMAFSTIWNMIKKMLNQEQEKAIVQIKDEDFPNLLIDIPKSQLEVKYGGNLENLNSFWPPKTTDFNKIFNEDENNTETDDDFFANSFKNSLKDLKKNKSKDSKFSYEFCGICMTKRNPKLSKSKKNNEEINENKEENKEGNREEDLEGNREEENQEIIQEKRSNCNIF